MLIDNVRDENFYDTNNANGYSRTSRGSTRRFYDDLTNRLVMSIDSFDWIHRTGANPPNEPVAGILCLNATARPFLYEGVVRARVPAPARELRGRRRGERG